ncbi:MAG TPA: alcohol dehydrogenase catalytic domain-containing protein, partial [Trebonia sp.]
MAGKSQVLGGSARTRCRRPPRNDARPGRAAVHAKMTKPEGTERMRALTWQGNEHVEVTDVPDPAIQEPNDVIIRVTSTAICGSDLHLYGVLGPYLKPGDVLG